MRNTTSERVWRLAAAIGVVSMTCGTAVGAPMGDEATVARCAAHPFDLSQVEMLGGPFQDAMNRNAAYLLQLEPDRLLSRVREYAGLEPKGKCYGGWEEQGISSHSLGHYLTACALQYAATGDERFKERAAYIVSEMAACQEANGNGYAAGIPRGKEIFEEVKRGEIRSQGFDLNGGWVPWYTMHKLLAGLRDVYLECRIEQARDVMVKLADYCWSIVEGLDDEHMQRMLACEHGGMNEVAADIYVITGDERHLRMAEKFYHKAVLTPLANEEDRLAFLHANTQVPKVIGAARLYELTGKDRYATIAKFFWDRVVHHYSYVNGGNSYNEQFGPADEQAGRLHDTTETCNTYNMLKLTRHLFAWSPRAELMDFYERALLNHILAHQHPETGMLMYKGFLMPATHKTFSTPFDSFWCCVGSGMENHTKYAESVYFHADDALYVNLFISSKLTWKDKGLTVTQRTGWPYSGEVALEVGADKPVEMTLKIRRPYWADGDVKLTVNGEAIAVQAKPGSYMSVQRTWKDGDRVELQLPMSLRYETMPDDTNQMAFFYGPTLLAAVLEEGPAATPSLRGQQDEVLGHIAPADGRLRFAIKDVAEPGNLQLMPLFEIGDERYSVYLEYFSPERWQEVEAKREAERQRQAALEARTVDFLQPGEMQPEREHNVTGEKTRIGRLYGSAWRDAYEGGWFSFEMGVDPKEPTTLICTYWGGDADRTFDVLVDGKYLLTQAMARPRPEAFVNLSYALPAEWTRGKEHVTVRLQAHSGNVAGGLFGCRTVREEAGR